MRVLENLFIYLMMLYPAVFYIYFVIKLQQAELTSASLDIWVIIISVSLGFSYRELSAAGGHNWLPAPLGWKLADAKNTSRTTEIGPSFFMMYISFAAQIHRSTITTVARPQLAGSREPATKAK
jgi:hypothetical protein